MESIRIKKLSKKKQNLFKQRNFNNRYTITEKPESYDSFSDPHSSYYFSSQTVMNNLRNLKKALEKQKNSAQKERLQSLIKQRKQMNMRITSIFKRRNQLQSAQQVNVKQLLRQTLGSLSFFKQINNDSNRNHNSTHKFSHCVGRGQKNRHTNATDYVDMNLEELVPQNPERKELKKKSVKTQEQVKNRLAQNLHHKKRIKWLNFLQERKNSLMASKTTQRDDPKEYN